ncbi:hypothetical protein PCIT_a2947 [Pseudoalteromonas citrea]|uniref:Uncharacterized protein n=2 Tax=Pseudoalteromonas citrea TaxID=43655 RepID=A0AAD4AHV5_9GAMM|nr:hypothetical protein [Pseudoalteromonas citrea]KAF7770008.1 hypothetical protein PCIT_a2947 [Pseudoalteromonas citrea]
MATIQNAVQAMVDKLVEGVDAKALSPEDQTLITNAISKLSNNARLEQALLAVAESHLDVATGELQQALTDGTNAMKNSDALLKGSNELLKSHSSQLSHIDSMESKINTIITQQVHRAASEAKPLFGLTRVESQGTSSSARTTAIFAIYDSSGETNAVRPCVVAGSTHKKNKLEYLTLSKDGRSKTVHHNPGVYENTFVQNPTDKIYSKGSSAILPLGLSTDHNNIKYEIVFNSQSQQSAEVTHYKGIFCKEVTFNSFTRPKKNLNARDKWGVKTTTDHTHSHTGVLYDNIKHCLVMVDDANSVIVEKYRDKNVVTNRTITSEAEYQQYVDAGDFTCVNFIAHVLNHPFGNARHIGALADSYEMAMANEDLSYYGYFGIENNVVKMGHDRYSAHYRFTEENKLEPLNYYFMSNSSARSSTHLAGQGEVTVALQSMLGELLGMYQYKSKPDSNNTSGGLLAMAINCINPYSNVGLLNEYLINSQYGIGRTCRAF